MDQFTAKAVVTIAAIAVRMEHLEIKEELEQATFAAKLIMKRSMVTVSQQHSTIETDLDSMFIAAGRTRLARPPLLHHRSLHLSWILPRQIATIAAVVVVRGGFATTSIHRQINLVNFR